MDLVPNVTNMFCKPGTAAAVCLYGSHDAGHGFIADTTDGRFVGDGELKKSWSMTDAYWAALVRLQKELGVQDSAVVAVFTPDGQRVAYTTVRRGGCYGYFGDLRFEPAAQLSLNCEQLAAMATEPS